jgi:hypothetical protein
VSNRHQPQLPPLSIPLLNVHISSLSGYVLGSSFAYSFCPSIYSHPNICPSSIPPSSPHSIG